MVNDIMQSLTSAVGNLSLYMLSIFEATGGKSLWISAITVFSLIRFFLFPVFGQPTGGLSSGSDFARGSNSNKKFQSSDQKRLNSSSKELSIR